MKRFRVVALLFLIVSCFSSVAMAQSLGEVAKKEKSRRDKSEKKSETVDEYELQKSKGDGFSVMGKEADDSASSRSRRSSRRELPGVGESSSGRRPSSTGSGPSAEEMRERRRAHAQRIAQAEAAVARASRAFRNCRSGRGSSSGACASLAKNLESAVAVLRKLQSTRP